MSFLGCFDSVSWVVARKDVRPVKTCATYLPKVLLYSKTAVKTGLVMDYVDSYRR